MSAETFRAAKAMMTLGFFPDWSLLFVLFQVVTANIKTRSVQDQTTLPCKSVPHQPQMHTVELSRTMMMLREVFYHDMANYIYVR